MAISSSGALADEADKASRQEAQLKESKALLKRVKDALGERVTEVRVSTRLQDSPACLVARRARSRRRMRRVLRPPGRRLPEAKPVARAQRRASAGEISGRREPRRAVRRSSRSCSTTRRRSPKAASSPIPPSSCSGSTACWCVSRGVAGRRGLIDGRRAPQAEAHCRFAGPAGALEALIETPVAQGGTAFGVDLPSASALWRHHGQQSRLYAGARLPGARRADDPLQLPWRGASDGTSTTASARPRTRSRSSPMGRRRWPGAALWLAGFSFGGAVAIRAAAARAGAARERCAGDFPSRSARRGRCPIVPG